MRKNDLRVGVDYRICEQKWSTGYRARWTGRTEQNTRRNSDGWGSTTRNELVFERVHGATGIDLMTVMEENHGIIEQAQALADAQDRLYRRSSACTRLGWLRYLKAYAEWRATPEDERGECPNTWTFQGEVSEADTKLSTLNELVDELSEDWTHPFPHTWVLNPDERFELLINASKVEETWADHEARRVRKREYANEMHETTLRAIRTTNEQAEALSRMLPGVEIERIEVEDETDRRAVKQALANHKWPWSSYREYADEAREFIELAFNAGWAAAMSQENTSALAPSNEKIMEALS